MALRIAQNTRSPSLTDTLTIDGAVFDLTGSSVKFQMRAFGSATLKVDTAATIVSPTAGTVRYDWGSSDLDTAGDFVGWWLVTLPSTKTQKHPDFLIDIQPASQPSASLCEIHEVRDYLKKPGGDRDEDTVIDRLIVVASKAIVRYTEREFAPISAPSTARTFRWDPSESLLSFGSYNDLNTVTEVALDPETSSPTVLATSLYALQPVVKEDGVWTGIQISPRVSPNWTDLYQDFGYRQVRVTGTWGFPSIPDDVRHACVATVGLWMRREVQALTTTFVIDEGRLERPEALPSAVKGSLASYRRAWGAY